MKLLLDNGADVDAPDAEGETPLASVLRSTSKRRDKLAVAAERLIQSGADPNRENEKGQTPVLIAGRKRDAENWLRVLEQKKVDDG
jgi:ankyrin repeat protein